MERTFDFDACNGTHQIKWAQRFATYCGLLALIMLPLAAQAQLNRYVVHFANKANSPYSLSNPSEFLSQRALARRQAQEIAITEADFPPNPAYVQQVKEAGAQAFFTSRWFNAVLVQMDRNLIQNIEALDFVDSVEFVAPGPRLNIRTVRIKKEPKKPTLRKQNTAFQNDLLDVPAMHADGYTGHGKLVAVFDGGFAHVDTHREAFGHLFDSGRIVSTYDFVANNVDVYKYDAHGTRCLGTFAANAPEINLVGTAPSVDVALYVTEDVQGEHIIEEYNWLFAAEAADSIGADVITASVGYSYFDDARMNHRLTDLDGRTAVSSRAAVNAARRGMVVITSAGNDGSAPWQKITVPADADSILAIGSVTSNLERSWFSSYGPTADGRVKPDLSCLGSSTVLPGNGSGTITGSGTSFAAPQIAGLVAGFWQANPDLRAQDVILYLKLSATQRNAPDTLLGYGIPSYTRAQELRLTSTDEVLQPAPVTIDQDWKLYPNPSPDGQISIEVGPALTGKTVQLSIWNTQGQQVWAQSNFLLSSAAANVIDAGTLPGGTYILRLDLPEGSTQARFIIQD